MPREVNVWLTDWHWTGSNVPTPQAQVDATIEWTGADGQVHDWAGTLTFPNDLQDVPVTWLREEVEDLLLRAARLRLGIDEAEG